MHRGPLTLLSASALAVVLVAGGCGPETLSDTSREVEVPSTAATPAPSTPPAVPEAAPETGPETGPGTDVPSGPEPGSSATAGPSPIVVGTAASGIAIPWGLAELPDGTVLVTSRDEHHLYRVAPQSGAVVDLGEIPGVESDGGEGGLLGVAVPATYAATKRIFLYYSTPTDNRIAYVTLRPGSPASLSRPTVVFSGIPRGFRHNGGRIAFGPDDMLYVGTGDAERPELSQDTASLGGKILRMTPEGRPAPGNPFEGSVVYSFGHRNVQGLTFDAQGRLFASELGDSGADELNWIRAGRNYGWPETEGTADVPGITDPVAQLDTDVGSPSGIAIAAGSVYLAALQGERLWRIPLDGTEPAGDPRGFLVGQLGRLRSVIALDEQLLLLSTSNTDGRATPRPGDDRLVLVRVG